MYLVLSYDDMMSSTSLSSVMIILISDAVLAPTLQVRALADLPPGLLLAPHMSV